MREKAPQAQRMGMRDRAGQPLLLDVGGQHAQDGAEGQEGIASVGSRGAQASGDDQLRVGGLGTLGPIAVGDDGARGGILLRRSGFGQQ